MNKTNIAYFEKILEEPPTTFKAWFEDEKKLLNEIVSKDSKVLSVGCGDGREMSYLLGKTKNLTGLDHDKGAVKHAKEKFKEYPNVRIILEDAEKMSFEDNSFDYVICIGTFTNLYDKKYAVLKEMKRVLKNKGKLIISCYSEDAWEERMKIYRKIGAPILKSEGTTVFLNYPTGADVSEQFSKEELEDIFQKANIKIERIKKSGIGYICVLSK